MEDQYAAVNVDTPGGRYLIRIGPGRLDALAESVPADASALALVTTQTVADLYGQRVLDTLSATGRRVVQVVLPDGEVHKTQASLDKIYDTLLEHQLDRKAVLVALGGGVVGDMAGFAAATYMRGVRFIQVPTTLLAQVDSSVGGKTGINHRLGKNMIGAFHQPIAVEIDTDVLQTLPHREISAGLAEVIKYGMIMDQGFFDWCAEHMAALRHLDTAPLMYAIQRSCELKAQVVSRDERESGLRAILNFGHTFAHAIEAGMGYGQWLHGEAVGCGMVQAAQLSQRALGLANSDVARITDLVLATGCPIQPPAMPIEQWMALMQSDKKTQAGQIRFVLLESIGLARVDAAPDKDVHAVLQAGVPQAGAVS